jgi:hypothetical protein
MSKPSQQLLEVIPRQHFIEPSCIGNIVKETATLGYFQNNEAHILPHDSRRLYVVGAPNLILFDDVLVVKFLHSCDLIMEQLFPLVIEPILHHFNGNLSVGVLVHPHLNFTASTIT